MASAVSPVIALLAPACAVGAFVIFNEIFTGLTVTMGQSLAVLFVFHVAWDSWHCAAARSNSVRKVKMFGQAMAFLLLSKDKVRRSTPSHVMLWPAS